MEALQEPSQDIGRVLQPTNLAANVAALNEDFRLGAQEDAHEFMSALLAALLSAYVPDEARVFREREKDTTAVHQLLQGVTASQTNCPKCNYTKANFEPFTEGGLSLEITMVRLCALDDSPALDDFCGTLGNGFREGDVGGFHLSRAA